MFLSFIIISYTGGYSSTPHLVLNHFRRKDLLNRSHQMHCVEPVSHRQFAVFHYSPFCQGRPAAAVFTLKCFFLPLIHLWVVLPHCVQVTPCTVRISRKYVTQASSSGNLTLNWSGSMTFSAKLRPLCRAHAGQHEILTFFETFITTRSMIFPL